jgi:hypothetical protein
MDYYEELIRLTDETRKALDEWKKKNKVRLAELHDMVECAADSDEERAEYEALMKSKRSLGDKLTSFIIDNENNLRNQK